MPLRKPEEQALEQIDAQLGAAGWVLQDISELNLSASRGVAVREVRSKGGPADYILFIDGKALGVIEAKKEGDTLSHEGVPLAVAKRAFGQDPKPLIEQLNAVLVA